MRSPGLRRQQLHHGRAELGDEPRMGGVARRVPVLTCWQELAPDSDSHDIGSKAQQRMVAGDDNGSSPRCPWARRRAAAAAAAGRRASRRVASTARSAAATEAALLGFQRAHDLLADGVAGPVDLAGAGAAGRRRAGRPHRAHRRRLRRRAVPVHAAPADPSPSAGRPGRAARGRPGRQADAAHGAGHHPRRERGLRAGRGAAVALQHLAGRRPLRPLRPPARPGQSGPARRQPVPRPRLRAAHRARQLPPLRRGAWDRRPARARAASRLGARHGRPHPGGVPGRPRSGRSRRRCSRATSPAPAAWSMAAGTGSSGSPRPTGSATRCSTTRSGPRHGAAARRPDG